MYRCILLRRRLVSERRQQWRKAACTGFQAMLLRLVAAVEGLTYQPHMEAWSTTSLHNSSISSSHCRPRPTLHIRPDCVSRLLLASSWSAVQTAKAGGRPPGPRPGHRVVRWPTPGPLDPTISAWPDRRLPSLRRRRQRSTPPATRRTSSACTRHRASWNPSLRLTWVISTGWWVTALVVTTWRHRYLVTWPMTSSPTDSTPALLLRGWYDYSPTCLLGVRPEQIFI